MNNWKRENNIALIEIEKLPNTTEEALVLPKPQTPSRDHEKLCFKENPMPQDPMTHPTNIKGENLERNDWYIYKLKLKGNRKIDETFLVLRIATSQSS